MLGSYNNDSQVKINPLGDRSSDEAKPNSSNRTWFGRRKDSEWVFRPLRLKFKVKELEKLYKDAVYRQDQSLLISACFIMLALSILALLIFLGSESVSGYIHY